MNFMTQLYLFLSLLALSQCFSVASLEHDYVENFHKTATICRDYFSGTILPHANDCHKFYVCVDRQPVEYNCHTDFHFDILTHSCVAGSACGNIEQITPNSCTNGAASAVKDDCYMFEACVNGQYQKISCKAGYYFNAQHSTCMPVNYNAEYKCNCVVPNHSVIENKDNCETYYECDGKRAVLEQCPSGQYYNSTINDCIEDLEGVCLMKPTKTPMIHKVENALETAAKALCSHVGKDEIEFQAIEGVCNMYSICANNQVHTKECPLGYFFDGELKNCVVDTNNKCQNGKK